MCEFKDIIRNVPYFEGMTKIHLLANGMMTGCGMMKNIGSWRMI